MEMIMLSRIVLIAILLSCVDGAIRNRCGKAFGVPTRDGYVIGGENAEQGEWPWMVALTELNETTGNQSPICTGFLIDNRHVISAAHCFRRNQTSFYSTRIGHVNLTQGDVYPISHIAVHNSFQTGGYYDDIALLTLSKDVNVPNFNPICLPPARALRNLTARGTTFVGWGATSRDGVMSQILKQLGEIPVSTNEYCNERFERFRRLLPKGITSNMICAGFQDEPGKDSCLGDSGGPLMILEQNRWYAVGVAAFGLNCGSPEYPGVYTRVSEYLNWINQTRNLAVSVEKQQVAADTTQNDADVCKGRTPSGYFRLTADGDCRSVVRCSAQGLLALRCPSGLAFDIESQICYWKENVKNCQQLEKTRLANPLLATDEPICERGKLACGSGECILKELFCNGAPDCPDGSDENACTVDKDPNSAPPCDPTLCVLPDCFCSPDGTQIPGKLEPSSVPQMITITFSDAVNSRNIGIYGRLFREGRNNPNGCTIKGTFFVSHQYTNYSAVQELHRKGHEIAAHSITHRRDEQYWRGEADVETWTKEMAGARLIIERFSNITDNSVVGIRAPYLRVGGNNQFVMMEEQAFLYDSTITAPLSNPPLWPYTLYFRMPHKCHGYGQKCPTRSHAVWEMVVNELDRRDDPTYDEELSGCAMLDSCSNLLTGEQFYNFLNHNLERHYRTNRAPLGLFFHASWLRLNKDFNDALIQWIDEMLDKDDIYFVTMTQVLQWMKDPTELSSIRDFAPWKEKCQVKGQPLCSLPNSCPLTTRELPGQTIRLHTCMECPQNYPWLEDPTGDYIKYSSRD